MSETTVITLNNGKKYEILMEAELENKKYCMVSELNESNQETENYLFFEIVIRDNKEVMRLVQDKVLLEQLTVLFTINYSKLADALGGA